MNETISKPLIMVKARKTKNGNFGGGHYCDKTDKWVSDSLEIRNLTTWCQSSTSNLGFFKSDPDSDKDDSK